MNVTQFFCPNIDGSETCYHVVSEQSLTIDQALMLKPFFQEFPGQDIVIQNSVLVGDDAEVGTRPARTTHWSSSAVAVLQDSGIPVERVEMTRRFIVPSTSNREKYIATAFDRMTECPYPKHDPRFLMSYLNIEPEAVFTVPVL